MKYASVQQYFKLKVLHDGSADNKQTGDALHIFKPIDHRLHKTKIIITDINQPLCL